MPKKEEFLRQYLASKGRVLVAFSGGVDSTYLLSVAKDTLEDNVLAVTGTSPSYPAEELLEAKALAGELGVRHLVVETDELSCPEFTQNPPERCYHCKKELFTILGDIAAREGIPVIIDGSNADDTRDFRPGSRAALEKGVESPLKLLGFTKQDIRRLAREKGLPNHDKPAQPCLSSRFPYGTPITMEKLSQVDRAERFLRDKGFKEMRVRHHGTVARIEIPQERHRELLSAEWLEEMLSFFKGLGFAYVTLDLQGFRSGSMNEILSEAERFEP